MTTGRFSSLLPVDIPGHTKVSYFSYSVFSFTGQQTIPGSNVSGIKEKNGNSCRIESESFLSEYNTSVHVEARYSVCSFNNLRRKESDLNDW